MKYVLILLLSTLSLSAQITGIVTDIKNEPLPYVSVYLENTFTGTTTNNDGIYNLNNTNKGEHTVVFKFLGYKTVKKTITITSFPFELNAKLVNEQVVLNEVLVSSKENPANRIIRSVMKNKDKNTEKWKNYTADFYSRGLFKIKNAPKKFMGKTVELPFPLDSTRSGIIYLSETVSKIKYQKKPNNFKEHIIASKVSGKDNGVSFNQAQEVNFDLYKNQVLIEDAQLFSPISDYAFNYYKFKLEGNFYENEKLISKIKIIPRNKNDRVFGGFIYIVENDWEIYGANLTVTGAQINNPAIDILHIKQNYKFDKNSKSWAIILQTIDFKAGMFGFKFSGRFSASYKNYNFMPNFTKKSFDNTSLSFEKNATKKDSIYWNELRSVPLTLEEKKDYIVKDSIKVLQNSKKYLDSVDTKDNKISLLSPIMGYSYKNSYKKWRVNYSGILGGIGYNTVQGFTPKMNINFYKRNNDFGNRWAIGTDLNYGFSDKKIRPTLYFTKRWNNIDKPLFNISLGNKVVQFDERKPISNIENALYTLFLKRNYTKLYEKDFAKVSFSKEIARGISFGTTLEYANRKPLVNTTNYSFFKKDATFYTNNPVNRTNTSPSFTEHKIGIANIYATFKFGSKYAEYPNSRYTIKNHKFPTLSLGLRKTFGAKNNNLNSNFAWLRLQQEIKLGNIGNFKYNARAGMFFKQKEIAFMDYYHPMGNEIELSPKNRLSSFYTLPYYKLSTNNRYAELHTEHNFKGFLLGKIPLLKKLNFHTVISAKSYFSEKTKPYNEYAVGIDNIGWGKWRFLRVDYVVSNFNNTNNKGKFMFGLSF